MDFNQQIYLIIHSRVLVKKLYTIVKVCYIMFVFSHYFGCWFYLLDQLLLEAEYYGPAPQNY